MLIEPAIYLNALMHDFLTAGGRIEVREFAHGRQFLVVKESARIQAGAVEDQALAQCGDLARPCSWNLEPDPAATSRILSENRALLAAMRA
jgi:hypothetical protein